MSFFWTSSTAKLERSKPWWCFATHFTRRSKPSTKYLHNSSDYSSESLKSCTVMAPTFYSFSSRSPIYLSFSLQKSFSTYRFFSKDATRSLSFSASAVRIATLFLSVSFSSNKDLTKGSDVATFFSKSKSFPETNRDSPKHTKKFSLSRSKAKEKEVETTNGT